MREHNTTEEFIAGIYARSLDDWGVHMQRLEYWDEARVWFARAIELNPRNVSAQINAEYNEHCRRGDKTRLEAASLKRQFQDLFNKYENWREILNANGPADEPTVLFEMGKALR